VEITAADDMPVQIPYQPQKAPVIPVTLGERRKTAFLLPTFSSKAHTVKVVEEKLKHV
jgi:hypothetical protein